jgi:V/A-type H+-transporting ATPase subunit I
MIVTMKKLWLICQKSDRDAALNRLAELGVVHVTPVVSPEGEAIDQARDEATTVEHALGILPQEIPEEAPGIDHTLSAPAVMHRIESYLIDRQKTESRMADLKAEIARVERFGNFDPQRIASLAEAGIIVKLVRYDAHKPPEFPEGAQLHILSEIKGDTHAALVSADTFEVENEVAPPRESLAALRNHLHDCEARMGHIAEHLSYMAAYRPLLDQHLAAINERHEMLSVSAGMGDTRDLVYLQGYCPVDEVQAVNAESYRSGWGLVVRDPDTDDQVPTLIRNPAWIRPIKAVFGMIGLLPGYREIDISAAFLLFFSVFFAMLIGDAGYGILFLVATLAARAKFRSAPAYPFHLLIILSACTVVWGVLTGTYFGVTNLPAPLASLTLNGLTGDAAEANIMKLCFFIGALHLSIAHTWNALRILNSTKALAQLGWIALTWTMFFTARTMILGAEFPRFGYGLLIGGFALVAIFMTKPREFKVDWANHVMLPLDVISNFVDVVSYVRLFAVGSASLAVAAAFNEMALAKGINSIGAGLGAAAILVLGHLLNIILGAMGILVHGVRLNTLEFSGHIGMQWTGITFRPFVRRTPSKLED